MAYVAIVLVERLFIYSFRRKSKCKCWHLGKLRFDFRNICLTCCKFLGKYRVADFWSIYNFVNVHFSKKQKKYYYQYKLNDNNAFRRVVARLKLEFYDLGRTKRNWYCCL